MEILFGKKHFDGIICLDASLPGPDILDMLAGVAFYAADGAAARLFNLGFMPDYIVGDLDSLYKSPVAAAIFDKNIIHKIESQETNDFEKTLDFAIAQGKRNLLIIGFHGGELEHTLNNWSVLIKYSDKAALCIYDKGRYCIPVNRHVEFPTTPDETISLIPQPEAKIKTENLNWNLYGETIRLGEREGARNFAVSHKVKIDILSGSLLLCFNHRLPFAPEYIADNGK